MDSSLHNHALYKRKRKWWTYKCENLTSKKFSIGDKGFSSRNVEKENNRMMEMRKGTVAKKECK